MKMRQHKILAQTLFILFVINFALAAPAAVRERPDHDANVTRDVTAASQKRWDPPDEGDSTNVPGAGNALPPGARPPSTPQPPPSARPPGAPQLIPGSSDWVQRVSMAPYSPQAQPLSALPPVIQRPSALESPLRVPALGPRPLRFKPLLQRPPGAPSSSAPTPGLQRQRPSVLPSRLRLPSARPPNTGDLYQQMRTAMQVAREAYIIDLWRAQQPQAHQYPGSSTGNVLPSPRPPTSSQLRPGFSGMRVGSMPGASSSTPLPPSTPASQPGPSKARPPGFPANPGASSSTGYQPSPGVMQETHSVPSAEDQPKPGVMQETHPAPSMEDQPNPGAKPETHSAPTTEDLPPDFWEGVWKDLPGAFKEAFSKSNIKPRTFHHQDDTC